MKSVLCSDVPDTSVTLEQINIFKRSYIRTDCNEGEVVKSMHRRQVQLKSLLSPYPEGAADILLQSEADSPEYVQMHVFVQTPHDMT